MTNPNDISSFYYDIVNSPLKGEEVVEQEIELIASLVSPGARILDVGCGTGRHLIPLSKLGFEVTGIDSSGKMLSVLKEKYPEAKVLQLDILEVDGELQKYDLIILMWNTFNEIAIEQSHAEKLIKNLKGILSSGGKILINSDNLENLDLEKFEFETNVQHGEIMYRQIWKGKLVNREKRITDSLETVELYNSNNSPIRKVQTTIKQRWWSREELVDLFSKEGFRTEEKSIRANDELYLAAIL